MMDIAAYPTWFILSMALVLGLIIGSFLNVVIYRLPQKLHQEFEQACSEHAGEPSKPTNDRIFGLNYLISPNSQCPSCATPIKVWQNIPIISYLLLRGHCHNCNAAIGIRYPVVELVTGLLTLTMIAYFGANPTGYFTVLLAWGLITLTAIDIDHQLLPDNITLPLLWIGILANLSGTLTDVESAIIGAVAGYTSLWFIFQLFRLLTGKEGMGYGDFKLFALLGAWLGWQMLPLIIMLASLLGAVLGIAWITLKGKNHQLPIPFGPYLAGAGLIALFWGEQINTAYLKYSGLM